MKPLKLLRNAAGISMVEVMMAVSVMGGLSLTVAQLMKNTSESTKQNEAKQENVNLKGLLQDNLNNTTACTNTFGAIMTPANVTALSGSPTASVTIPNVKDKINAIKYSTTSTNIQPLTITSMILTNYNSTAFTGDFLVNATFNKSTNNIVMVKPIRIPINFSFSGTTLTACSTMAVGGEWMLGGNAGTVDGTDYLGTSDNVPLNFRVNAQRAGRIDSVGQVFMGYQSGNSVTTGLRNTGMGYRALNATSTGHTNTSIGFESLLSNTGGAVNTALGAYSLRSNTTGNHNVGIGNQALYFNTTGISNIGLGNSTLQANTTGNDNIAIGYAGLYQNTIGINNVSVGTRAAQGNTSASFNTAVGYEALMHNQIGVDNTAMGSHSLQNNQGSYNAGLGRYAGQYNSSGSYNTYLGYQSGSWAANSSGSRNVFIGSFAGNTVPGVTTASNKLYIESSNNSTPLIGGDFSARKLYLDGSVGIDLNAGDVPQSKLVVGPHSGNTNTTAWFSRNVPGISGNALYASITPSSDNYTYIGIQGVCSVAAGAVSSYCLGMYGFGGYQSAMGMGRSYGVRGRAQNGTPGWNYGVQGFISGTTVGTGIYGSTAGDIDMTTYHSSSTAGFFYGNVYVTGTVYSPFAHTISSDRRLKKEIKTLDNSLERILKLRGVSYRWKEANPSDPSNREQIGLIAQEVEEHFPQIVNTNKTKKGETKSLQYSQLVSPIIEAIKELYAKFLVLVSSDEKQNLEIKILKAENVKLKNQMKAQQESFEVRMKKLEAEMAKKKMTQTTK